MNLFTGEFIWNANPHEVIAYVIGMLLFLVIFDLLRRLFTSIYSIYNLVSKPKFEIHNINVQKHELK